MRLISLFMVGAGIIVALCMGSFSQAAPPLSKAAMVSVRVQSLPVRSSGGVYVGGGRSGGRYSGGGGFSSGK